MSNEAAPTGAATVTTETVSPQTIAAEKGDFSAFQDADRATRAAKIGSGDPPAKIERPKVVGKDGAAAKGPSAKDADADARLTQRIKDAVQTSTAAKDAELADLRRKLEDATRPPARRDDPPAASTEAQPRKSSDEYKKYLAMPDAPKEKDFDSIVDHGAAMAVFISDKRHEERVEREAQGRRELEHTTGRIERIKTFQGRVQAFKTAAPERLEKLTPEIKALHGWDRLQADNAARQARGEAPLQATVDHAIAEEIYESELPMEIAVHLSEHPEDFAALRACKTPDALIRSFARLEDKVRAASPHKTTASGAGAGAGGEQSPKTTTQTTAEARARAAEVVDRSVSRADPPVTTLGKSGTDKDPLQHALETGDIGSFLDLDRTARAEKRGFRHA